MNPDLWGSSLWYMIHSFATLYPANPTQTDMDITLVFYEHLAHLIPCHVCRGHYNTTILKYPLTRDILGSRKKYFEWGYNMHNFVNSHKSPPFKYPLNVSRSYEFWKKSNSQWPSRTWIVLHSMALITIPSNYTSFKKFMVSLSRMMRLCGHPKWGDRFKYILSTTSPSKNKKYSVFKYLYRVHKRINNKKYHKSHTPEYENVLNYYLLFH